MEKPIKILTFTPVYQRREVFEICLAGIKRLVNYDKKRFNIQPFFIVSELWAAQLLTKLKYEFLFAANHPLGNKKNEGLKYVLQSYQFDYLMEIGSDDILTDQYLEIILPLMLEKTPQFHLAEVYFVDVRTADTAYWKTDKVLGAGRCISRKAIETVTAKTTLWNPEGARGMDTFSFNQLMKSGIGNKIIQAPDHHALDIKSEVNINQLYNFKPSPKTIDQILAPFPEKEMINKLISKHINPSVNQSINLQPCTL